MSTLHVAGGALFAWAMTQSDPLGLTTAAALTAYLLGVRHAFDPDHIVAIDNTTRFLRSRHRPAGTVGFWFALGHSSVVLLACVLLGWGWNTLTVPATSIWGPVVSGTFLLALAVVNARILHSVWRHRHDPASSEVAARGFVMRLIGPRWSIRRPRQMMLVGFLFGLGFDTATSVGILLLSAGAEEAALPWSAFVALPLLFAAGMTLFDTLDGVAMDRAYRWADSPSRRVGYRLAVTATTVVAGLVVGILVLANLVRGFI